MNDPATTLDRLVARAGRLYSLPAVAMKVLELTNNPQVDAHALKECIENDPALTSRILGVVNSSLFGLSREVSDLNQALAMLGSKPLKLLVLGFSLPAGLFSGVGEKTLGRYWRHTLTKAVAGREISETLWHAPGDDAFIAGLLQDLGMLLLIQELQEPYVKFLDKAHATGRDLAELEIDSMGFDHTQLSARLLAHWGLPEMLVEAVVWDASHHESDGRRSSPRALPQILHLAELVARLLADERSDVLGELLEVGRHYRDLSEDQLESLVGNLEEKIEQLADVLSLQLPQGLDYRDVLAQAHSQLSEVAGEAAREILRNRQGEALKSEEESILAELKDLAAAVARVSARPADPGGAERSPSPEAAQAVDAPGRTATEHRRAAESTAVEVDPGLLGRLGVVVAACRQSRCPLSLVLVQLDRLDELVVNPGVRGFGELRQALEDLCRRVDHPCAICLAYGDAGFALILPHCERPLAVQLASQLIEQLRRSGLLGADDRRATSISVGAATVALPPKNFPPEDLLAAADRCLYGSQASGGSVVKRLRG
ncbi:MAG: HDOD domain-containing protein [Planctomycetota bacterium]|jgi:HD-like signal output (HDOD) protein/GGDEF domain-containing protein